MNTMYMEIIPLTLGYFTGYLAPNKAASLFPVFLIIHGYAFMLHRYNKLLAQNRIDFIKKNNLDRFYISSKELKQKNRNSCIKINIKKTDEILVYYLTFDEEDVSPYFLTLEKALLYRTYIYNEIGSKDIVSVSNYIYMNEMKELYNEHKNKKNK
uniref:Transmembrane protein n=1 Tax=Mimivirus LCMiAC02 TaxID=2506609 RepID=A0A481Z2G5_9VIRU|nr:MAG: hypothetical protein LCMiAC02_00870 [Mimivirus LCMiAC02]